MSWSPGLDLDTLHPGRRKRGTGLLKRRLVKALVRKGTSHESADRALVRFLNPLSTLFNRRTRTAVMVFQKRNGLKVDGIVGRTTWLALGFAESDLMPLQLRGIPYPGGNVRPLDGNWIALPLWNILVAARKAGAWLGDVNSGWRPDWYQKILWDAAVKRYGSPTSAAKWVAPPGTSKHRFADERGAVDVTKGEPLLNRGMYRPMSWESWHFQIRIMSTFLDRALNRGQHPELALGPSIPEAEPDVTVPDGVDMDMVLAYVEYDLDECELHAEAVDDEAGE